jgi:hypothetical protein
MTQAVESLHGLARQRKAITAGEAQDDAKKPARTVRTWFSMGPSCVCPELSVKKAEARGEAARGG